MPFCMGICPATAAASPVTPFGWLSVPRPLAHRPLADCEPLAPVADMSSSPCSYCVLSRRSCCCVAPRNSSSRPSCCWFLPEETPCCTYSMICSSVICACTGPHRATSAARTIRNLWFIVRMIFLVSYRNVPAAHPHPGTHVFRILQK